MSYDDASDLPLLTPGPPLAIWISQKLWREGSSRCQNYLAMTMHHLMFVSLTVISIWDIPYAPFRHSHQHLLQVHLIGGFADASTKVGFRTCWLFAILLSILFLSFLCMIQEIVEPFTIVHSAGSPFLWKETHQTGRVFLSTMLQNS